VFEETFQHCTAGPAVSRLSRIDWFSCVAAFAFKSVILLRSMSRFLYWISALGKCVRFLRLETIPGQPEREQARPLRC